MKSSIKFTHNRQRIDKNGLATIYIRVIINRQKKDIPLDIRWPVARFDWKAGVCKPRFEHDRECEDNNILLRRELTKCNEIFRYYRLADIPITINRFMRDYRDNLSKSNFISYMEAKVKSRHVNREIAALTYKKHLSTINKLKEYAPKLLFTDFDENWGQDFDNWLKKNIKSREKSVPGKKKKTHSQNTRWSHHKNIKVYLNLAKKDQIRFNNPYDWFSISAVKGNWQAIFEKDVKTLYNYYQDKNCPDNHRQILRAFLFSCMTGLRISDIIRVTQANVMDGLLIFLPHKTQKNNEILKIPLNKMARELYDDAVESSLKDQIFNNFSEQYANRTLKEIGEKNGITKNLHWHVGRHTFISIYYAKTKDLIAAQEFAGHKNIRQTRIYTHLNPSEIKDRMKPMDDILDI